MLLINPKKKKKLSKKSKEKTKKKMFNHGSINLIDVSKNEESVRGQRERRDKDLLKKINNYINIKNLLIFFF